MAAAAGTVVIGGAHALDLLRLPQLEILEPIVGSIAVLVVDVLVRFELAAEAALHHEAVLEWPCAAELL